MWKVEARHDGRNVNVARLGFWGSALAQHVGRDFVGAGKRAKGVKINRTLQRPEAPRIWLPGKLPSKGHR